MMDARTYNIHVYRRQRHDRVPAATAISRARYSRRGYEMGFSTATPTEQDISNELAWIMGPTHDRDAIARVTVAMCDELFRELLCRWGVVLRGEYAVLLQVCLDPNYGDSIAHSYGTYSLWGDDDAVLTAYERSRRGHWRPRTRKPRRLVARRFPQLYKSDWRPIHDEHEKPWFIPNYTVRERHADYIKRGYARHDAWLLALRDVRRDEERAHGEHTMAHYLMATVFDKRGNVVGISSLSGCEVDTDTPESEYVAQLAQYFEDIIADALPQGKDALP